MLGKTSTGKNEIIQKNPLKNFRNNWEFLLLCMPVVVLLFIFNYLPLFGIVIAFRDYRFDLGIWGSPWVGFENFRFLFQADVLWRLVRNTVGYSLSFLFFGTISALVVALLLYQVKSKVAIKYYQTSMILPHFISMVIVSYLVYIFLEPSRGTANQVLGIFGVEPVNWYGDPVYWPFILNIVNIWNGVGMGAVIYFAALVGLDKGIFEAAEIDGANRMQQTLHISLPSLMPLVGILTLLGLGSIFSGDFGMFFQVPRDIGVLYPATDVVDTFVYRALRAGHITRASAVGLIQSVVGSITIVTANLLIRKINPDSSLF